MKIPSAALLLSAFIVSPASFAASSFTLICQIESKGPPVTYLYKVDLDSRTIIRDSTKRYDITRYNDSIIEAEGPWSSQYGGTTTFSIDRVTGELYGETKGAQYRVAPLKGTCEKGLAKF